MLLPAVPTKTKEPYHKFLAKLEKKHKYIGEGRDSTVLAYEKGIVIKAHRMYTGTRHSDPYWNFLREIPTENRFFPKVYDVNLYRCNSKEYATVVMERLQTTDYYHKASTRFMKDFGYKGGTLSDVSDFVYEWIVTKNMRKMGVCKGTMKWNKTKPVDKVAQEMLDVLDSLVFGHADCHLGNFMIRNRSQIVLIDPVA